MDKKTFESGRSAMGWLLGGDKPSTGKDAKLDREIAEVLTKAPKPTRQTSPRKASAPKSSPKSKPAKTPTARRHMSLSDFMASLPPALSRRGDKSASVKDVVNQIRADLAAAIQAGVLPDGTQISITNKDYNSINIKLTRWPAQVFTDKYLEHLMDPKGTKWVPPPYDSRTDGDARLTPELSRAIGAITKIAERHNYRHMSNPYDDYAQVGYYLHVSASPVIESATVGAELESNKELQAKLAEAHKAAAAIGPAATKSICGNKDISRVGTGCLDQLIKIADRAKGRPVEYDARRRGWYPVDPAKAHLGKLKLGNTTYEIVSKSKDDNDYSLLGPRGGWSSLVQNAKKADQWAHVGFSSSDRAIWYQRNADGTFTRI